MTCGLLRPDSGTVAVAGHDVWADPVGAKTRLGMVPDNPVHVHPAGRPGTDRVQRSACGEWLRAVVSERADSLLRLLDLEEAADTLIADYSLGMTKKVAIACALLHSPRVVFLDEPFAGIDPVARQVLETTLSGTPRAGGTVVFSDHTMDVVERLCDRIMIIDEGSILTEGPTAEITGGRRLQESSSRWWAGAVPKAWTWDGWALLSTEVPPHPQPAQAIGGMGVDRLHHDLAGGGVPRIPARDSSPTGRGTCGAAMGLRSCLPLVGLGWLVIPVVAAALDETVDPRRLELLPLSRGRLAAGLLAAAAIGPGTVITVLAVAGAVDLVGGRAGQHRPHRRRPGCCSWFGAWPRPAWSTTFLTDLLRSRRGRDVAVVAVSLAVAVVVDLRATSTDRYRETLTGGSPQLGQSWNCAGVDAPRCDREGDGRFRRRENG